MDAVLWAEAMSEFEHRGLPPSQIRELQKTYQIGGRPPKAGEVFSNGNLAETYERIANGGRESFYQGETAQRIVEAISSAGGQMQLSDLAQHKGEWVTPVSANYRGYDVYELPPNSQGIAALQMLNILEAFPLADLGRDSAGFWHLVTEAKKLAYEDRARFYADPDFADIPVLAISNFSACCARTSLAVRVRRRSARSTTAV